MICRPCARAADYATVLGAEWATSKHQTCPGDTWCDCQHRIPAGIPRSMAAVGTAENGQLVALAAGIELEDLDYRAAKKEIS
jgi:hypothetical protein